MVTLFKNEDFYEINIISAIGKPNFFSDGYSFSDLKNDLDNAGGKDIKINLNSPGGYVLDAFSMYDLIKNYKGKTSCYIFGQAASAATVVASACDEVYMSELADYLIHASRVGATITKDMLKNLGETLSDVDEKLIRIYQSKSGLNADELEALMDGSDHVFSAKEALKKGFIDKILFTTKAEDIIQKLEANAEIFEVLASDTKIKYIDTMDLEIQAKYEELEASYSDLQNKYNEEIEAMRTSNEELTGMVENLNTEKESLVNEKTELENKVAELNTEKIQNFIDGAVTAGRITEPQKEHYLKLASSDFETVKEIVNSIPVRTKISEVLNTTSETNLHTLIKGKESWDEIDFEKKNEIETLERIKNEFPEYYSLIHKKAYPNLG